MWIIDLINKDVKAENERKRTIVTLRILYIIVFMAFLLDVIFAGTAVIARFPYRIVIFFSLIIILFIYSYHSSTKPSLYFCMLFLLLWTLMFIPCFGWSAGMQNYFIIILLLCFFALHGRLVYKFLYSGSVLALRILTIGIFGGTKPIVPIGFVADKLIQITNISAVFVSIIMVSYVFSKEDNEDEAKLMKYNDKLRQEASTDQLTGLLNRRAALEYISSIEKEDEIGFLSIAMGDIDFFKKVNDTYGHDAGDDVLKAIAAKISEEAGEGAVVVRWGGEEFLILFPGLNGDKAYLILEGIRSKIQKSIIKSRDSEIKVTMTFGLAEYSFVNGVDEIIKEADNKLYQGKTNGRNQVVY